MRRRHTPELPGRWLGRTSLGLALALGVGVPLVWLVADGVSPVAAVDEVPVRSAAPVAKAVAVAGEPLSPTPAPSPAPVAAAVRPQVPVKAPPPSPAVQAPVPMPAPAPAPSGEAPAPSGEAPWPVYATRLPEAAELHYRVQRGDRVALVMPQGMETAVAYMAVLQRDFPVIQGVAILSSTIFVVINILVDLVAARIDPRLEY